MFYRKFLIFFLIVYANISFSYGLDEKLLKEIIEGELEILDTENYSEDRKLFDSVILFFSKKNS